MPEMKDSFAPGSYPGLPAAPPVLPQTPLPAGAPILGLGLNVIIILVSGDVRVTSSLENTSIVPR